MIVLLNIGHCLVLVSLIKLFNYAIATYRYTSSIYYYTTRDRMGTIVRVHLLHTLHTTVEYFVVDVPHYTVSNLGSTKVSIKFVMM